MISVIGTVLAMPVALWLALMPLVRGRRFEMDPNGVRYAFYAIFVLYRRLSYTIFGVSGLMALTGAVYARGSGNHIVLLTSAAIYALLFQVWLTWQYERYLHQRYRSVSGMDDFPSPYTGAAYAVTISLGVSALVMFCAGFIGIIAVLLGR